MSRGKLFRGKYNIDWRPREGPDYWLLLCADFSLWLSVRPCSFIQAMFPLGEEEHASVATRSEWQCGSNRSAAGMFSPCSATLATHFNTAQLQAVGFFASRCGVHSLKGSLLKLKVILDLAVSPFASQLAWHFEATDVTRRLLSRSNGSSPEDYSLCSLKMRACFLSWFWVSIASRLLVLAFWCGCFFSTELYW